ncbi:MAG: diguanylate cyclase [Burkholderiales bacterium]|nr:diguanylate cyclase [Burkholderiales bacterium]
MTAQRHRCSIRQSAEFLPTGFLWRICWRWKWWGNEGTQAAVIGQKIISALNLPFELAGRAHHTSPSIGVAIFSGLAADVDELIKRADEAMYQSKAAGRNTLRFYAPTISDVD